MKLNKNLGRIATTFLATAMLASVSAVPAFAVESEPTTLPSGLQNGATITIDKNLMVGEKLYTPDVDFSFIVEPANPTEKEERNGATVEAGLAGDITVGNNASFDAGTTAMTEDTLVKADQKATFTVNLNAFADRGPGVYKYTVKEDSTTNPYDGVTYDDSVKTLYVTIIQGDSGLEVKSTELVNEDNSKTNDFNNDYDAVTETLHDVTIIKKVEGDFGDKVNDVFKFTVSVDGEENETYYVEYVEGGNQTTVKTDAIKEGEQKTFDIRNDGYVKIYGLDRDDTYTVTESEYADKGYTAYVDTAYVEGNTHESDGVQQKDNITDATISNDSTVAIYNVKTGSVATGVMMDIAPYALLVVVAAAGCFVFLRKRRED